MSDPECDLPQKPPVSIWKRLFVGGVLFVLVVTALGLVQYYWQRSRDGDALQRAMGDLDESDPGWRLEEIEAARATIPDERNSAHVVKAAYRRKPRNAFSDAEFYKLFYELRVPVLLDAEWTGRLDAELKSAASAVIEARKLVQMPEGRHQLVWKENPILTLLEDQQSTRSIASLLQFDALHLAQMGKATEALRSCRAALNAGRSLDDEPLIISQLIRISCGGVAASAAERVLALGEPAMEELVALQNLAEAEEAHPSMAVGFRGERAILHLIFKGVAENSISLRDMPLEGVNELRVRERYARWTLRRMARAEHPRMLETLTRVVDVARLPMHEQAAAERAIKDDLRKVPSSSLTRMFLPGLTSLGDSSRRKAAAMRCLKVLLALERYRREKGTWPAKLEELTPKLLKAVPLDPFDGKPLRYKRLADSVIVYSIGVDGTDNGGNIDRARPNNPGTDLGFQLWDGKHRRQSLGAKPAALK